MGDVIPASVRLLMAGAIDYAGLFPPAELRMPAAVEEYAAQRTGRNRWALGRFVVPAARLDEFVDAARATELLPAPANRRVELSVLAAGDLPAGLAAVREFQAETAEQGALITAIETRATTAAQAADAARAIPPEFEAWVEIPWGASVGPLIEALIGAGGMPKIRTGGVVPELFPDPETVMDFLVEAVRRDTPFKATAGLHHPLRGNHPLTYQPDSACGVMYGFLNLMLATAMLLHNQPAAEARRVLLEEDPEAFDFGATGLTWRGRRFDASLLETTRRRGLRAFGSCSFREPLDELLTLVAR